MTSAAVSPRVRRAWRARQHFATGNLHSAAWSASLSAHVAGRCRTGQLTSACHSHALAPASFPPLGGRTSDARRGCGAKLCPPRPRAAALAGAPSPAARAPVRARGRSRRARRRLRRHGHAGALFVRPQRLHRGAAGAQRGGAPQPCHVALTPCALRAARAARCSRRKRWLLATPPSTPARLPSRRVRACALRSRPLLRQRGTPPCRGGAAPGGALTRARAARVAGAHGRAAPGRREGRPALWRRRHGARGPWRHLGLA